MKGTGHLEKWASGVLGAVCLVLVMNLVLEFTGVRAGGSRQVVPAPASGETRRVESSPRQGQEELARYDPEVRLETLEKLRARPLPQLDRNPFEFEARARRAEPAAPPPPPQATPPPAPPPVPLTALGYAEKPGGIREAYVSDGDQVFIVHEGESFATTFKVLKISPTAVEIEDATYQRTVQLPIPQ